MGSKCCLQIELPFFIDHKPLYKEYRQACSISPYHCLQWVQLAISIDVVYRWEKFARAFRTYDILVKFNRLGNTYEILARVSSRFFHGNGLLNLFNNYLKIRSRMCMLINHRYPWTKEATDYYCNEITIELSSVIFFESSTCTGNKSLVDARTLTRCVDDSRCLFLLCLFSLWFHSCTVTWICYIRITNLPDQHLRFALSKIFNNNNVCVFLLVVYTLLINYKW